MNFSLTRYRSYIAVLLFILPGLIFANSALNRHLHLFQGQVISHAHPYQKNADEPVPVKSHHHSDFEFLIIDQISNLLIVAGITLYLTTIVILIRIVGITAPKAFLKSSGYFFHHNKAPPVNILF